LFEPARITEGNFLLVDTNFAGAVAGTGFDSGRGTGSTISPIMVKYIDTTTIILRSDELDIKNRYNVRFNAISDFSGQYVTRYPEQGSSIALRNGKR
jgi:hypothetical protein